MASPIDCNQSLFSYNANDYIDLKTALTEEELSHSSNSRANSRESSYKYTLKSMDDTELDQFRRSLVTPLSANYKFQDPMYNNMTFNNNARQQQYNRKLKSISPTNSVTTDTAESVALFNRISNDEHNDVEDFVKTDLKDYMGSFNLDDLISRPGSGNTAHSPLPPLSSRYNRQSPLLQQQLRQQYHHGNDTTKNTTKTNINTYINDDNEATNLDNINKVTPTKKPATTTLKYNTLPRKLSFDTSVLAASSSNLSRRASFSAIQPTKEEEEQDIPTRNRRTDSIKQEKLAKRLSLLTLKEKSSGSPSSNITQQQLTLRRLQQQPSTTNNSSNRRWSSYIPDQQVDSTTESKLGQLRSNSIRQQPANTEQRHSVLISSSRYKERRTSTSSNNDNNRVLPPQVTSSSVRYTSQRNSTLLEQQPQQRANTISARDITKSSRYAQRRESASSNSSNVDIRSKTLTAPGTSSTSLYVERRTSYRDPAQPSSNTMTSKRASYQADVVSSGYGQQRSPPMKPTNTAAANEKNLLSTVQQQRRVKALSVPPSANNNPNANYNDSSEQPLKPSLIAVPVSRYRKTSNGSLSKYSSNIPENEAIMPVASLTKEVRFSSMLTKKRNSTSGIEGVQLVASRSTGGYSNSTASSSHSSFGDLDYDPPTPPTSYSDYEKRRSIPVYKEAPSIQQAQPRLKKYNSYLERLKDAYGVEEEEEDDFPVAAATPVTRRQRVVSEDNEHYYRTIQRVNRQQQQASTNQVTHTARQVLAHLQEKRARTAAYLNK